MQANLHGCDTCKYGNFRSKKIARPCKLNGTCDTVHMYCSSDTVHFTVHVTLFTEEKNQVTRRTKKCGDQRHF